MTRQLTDLIGDLIGRAGATFVARNPDKLRRGHRSRDRLQRGVGLGAIGAAGLRHVGTAAAALAAERLGGDAHQIDRVEARGEIAA